MSAPMPLGRTTIHVNRNGLLAAASAALAAGSVAVTLAVSTGGDAAGTTARSAAPATAKPDAATIYHRSLSTPQPDSSAPEGGRRAAERFHHFR